jgi:hypothetical protein
MLQHKRAIPDSHFRKAMCKNGPEFWEAFAASYDVDISFVGWLFDRRAATEISAR